MVDKVYPIFREEAKQARDTHLYYIFNAKFPLPALR